ncbi:HD domain-containing phosphohydrolase [Paenibacillus sp. LPE1-1-1.1]|uniref:HD domain-containing phosphohydrolase n=1 Tax=Paenibacillus sp. LPE1-1-1.1 TaxID=3135230 RepID=UPI00342D59C2
MSSLNDQLVPYLKLADAVIITDKEHLILAVNPAYEKITGYSSTEIIGKKAGILRTHTQIGVDIIDKIYAELNDDLFNQELAMGKNIILYHHEKWDGTGYPQKLSGESIPIEARIVSVVDVFDALTSIRPYKEKWSEQRAVAYIREQRGRHFDPDLVDSFLALIHNESV